VLIIEDIFRGDQKTPEDPLVVAEDQYWAVVEKVILKINSYYGSIVYFKI